MAPVCSESCYVSATSSLLEFSLFWKSQYGTESQRTLRLLELYHDWQQQPLAASDFLNDISTGDGFEIDSISVTPDRITPPGHSVPDAGPTAALLASAFAAVTALRPKSPRHLTGTRLFYPGLALPRQLLITD